MKTIGIIGFGSFGELLANLAKNEFEVTVIELSPEREQLARSAGFATAKLKDIGRLDILVFAVPISAIEDVVKEAAQYTSDDQLALDICSVKVYPATVMKKYLGNCQLIATHPMFGPESASKGLSGLQVAICPLSASQDNVQMIKDFWQKLGITTIITTPEDHDTDAAYSQAFAYSIAKILLGIDIGEVKLRTRSFDALMEVARLSANDSDQLFHDMLYYNPYYIKMKEKLLSSINNIEQKLNEIEAEQKTKSIFTAEG